MRDLQKDLLASGRGVVGGALLLCLTTVAIPAHAQDLLGLFRLFGPPVTRVPVYAPYHYRAVPDLERRPLRRRPKVVRLEQPPTKPSLKPKAPGEAMNPVPELLADSTLRRGDIVMFPDGPRVFVGEAGPRHAMADFEPVSQAGSVVPTSTRKLIASMSPGLNDAWNAGSSGKVAANTKGVEATGSLRRSRR